MKSLCIIPCWNEEDKLLNLINQIKNFDQLRNKVDFLFINNGSNDDSLNIIKNEKIPVISFEKNKGAGYALIYGLKLAQKENYEYMVHLAANGKMLPDDIHKFLDKIVLEKFDFVHGSRFLKGSDHSTNPKKRIILIKILTFFINILFKKKITDATCGFRAFKTKLI